MLSGIYIRLAVLLAKLHWIVAANTAITRGNLARLPRANA